MTDLSVISGQWVNMQLAYMTYSLNRTHPCCSKLYSWDLEKETQSACKHTVQCTFATRDFSPDCWGGRGVVEKGEGVWKWGLLVSSFSTLWSLRITNLWITLKLFVMSKRFILTIFQCIINFLLTHLSDWLTDHGECLWSHTGLWLHAQIPPCIVHAVIIAWMSCDAWPCVTEHGRYIWIMNSSGSPLTRKITRHKKEDFKYINSCSITVAGSEKGKEKNLILMSARDTSYLLEPWHPLWLRPGIRTSWHNRENVVLVKIRNEQKLILFINSVHYLAACITLQS